MNCKLCNQDKPQTKEFYRQYLRNGKTYWDKQCKSCVAIKKNEARKTPEARERHRITSKIWRHNNKQLVRQQKRERYRRIISDPIQKELMFKRCSERSKKWKGTESGRAWLRLDRKRRRLDPVVRIRESVSRRINHGLKKGVESILSILPYSLQELKKHLEDQFVEGMSWDNYGYLGWHIDHIRPVSSFDIKSVGDSEFLACWNLSNLRPLWARENFRKGARLEQRSKSPTEPL